MRNIHQRIPDGVDIKMKNNNKVACPHLEYLCQNGHGYVLNQIHPVLSSFMIYRRVCNQTKTTVSLEEQKLLTLPEYFSLFPFLLGGGGCVAQSLVFCVVFCRPF